MPINIGIAATAHANVLPRRRAVGREFLRCSNRIFPCLPIPRPRKARNSRKFALIGPVRYHAIAPRRPILRQTSDLPGRTIAACIELPLGYTHRRAAIDSPHTSKLVLPQLRRMLPGTRDRCYARRARSHPIPKLDRRSGNRSPDFCQDGLADALKYPPRRRVRLSR